MIDQPLALPAGDPATVGLFLEHFRLGEVRAGDVLARRIGAPERSLLEAAAAALARLPYENLTKILKLAEWKNPERARRSPREVLEDHIAFGAGGTCFSLTALALHILRALGWRAEPILADRRYGANTHCALVVWVEGEPHLLDPGFLIVKPIPLGAREEKRVSTPFNELLLAPRRGGELIDLHTLEEGRKTYRLTFKVPPADAGEFLRAWDASFGWDMMRYPLLTRVKGAGQIYLQGSRLQVRTREGVERTEIDLDDLPGRIAAEFGLDPSLAARALAVLWRKGELHGKAPAP